MTVENPSNPPPSNPALDDAESPFEPGSPQEGLFLALMLEEPLDDSQARLLDSMAQDPEQLRMLEQELSLYRKLPQGASLGTSMVYPPAEQPALSEDVFQRLMRIPELEQGLPDHLLNLNIPVENAVATSQASVSSFAQVMDDASQHAVRTTDALNATPPSASQSGLGAGFTSGSVPESASGSGLDGFVSALMEALRSVWAMLMGRPAFGLAFAAALALMVVLPKIGPQPRGLEADGDGLPAGLSGSTGVLKGGEGPRNGSEPTLGHSAGLSLVSRESAEAPVYRLPLEELSGEQFGVRVKAAQQVLPVLQYADGSLSSKYGLVLLAAAGGEVRVLQRPLQPLLLQPLPGTEHLFALPEPVELPAFSGQARLYVLLTERLLGDSSLKLIKENAVRSITSPGLLLVGSESLNAVEGTLMLESVP